MNNNLHLTYAELARLEPVVAELEKKWDKEKEASASDGKDKREKALLVRITNLRKAIAGGLDIPVGYVFRDYVLSEMVKVMPKNREALLKIKGINMLRASVFGPRFLSELWS